MRGSMVARVFHMRVQVFVGEPGRDVNQTLPYQAFPLVRSDWQHELPRMSNGRAQAWRAAARS